MTIENNENIPFSLFISTKRRKHILHSMFHENEEMRKKGERILSNYKKQLAEKLAREHIEKAGQTPSKRIPGSRGSARSNMTKTMTSFKSGKTAKSSKAAEREKESEAQKLI